MKKENTFLAKKIFIKKIRIPYIRLSIGFLSCIFIALTVVLLQESLHEQQISTNSTLLYYNDFNAGKEGTKIQKMPEWKVYTSLKENQNSQYWFLSTNALFKQYYIPADYSDDQKQFISDIAVTGNQNWENYILNIRIQPEDTNDVGVIFRFTSSANYYFLCFSKDNKNNTITYLLNKKIKNHVTQIKRYSEVDSQQSYINSWEQIGIAINGNTIKVFKNTKPLLEATDTTFSKGSIGIYTLTQTSAYFDNIKVYTAE